MNFLFDEVLVHKIGAHKIAELWNVITRRIFYCFFTTCVIYFNETRHEWFTSPTSSLHTQPSWSRAYITSHVCGINFCSRQTTDSTSRATWDVLIRTLIKCIMPPFLTGGDSFFFSFFCLSHKQFFLSLVWGDRPSLTLTNSRVVDCIVAVLSIS